MKVVVKILVLMSILTLCGCSANNEKEKSKVKKEPIENYSLVSTEDRLVFNQKNKYEIVNYENDKIVKVETAIKFKTEEEALKYYKQESFGSSYEIKVVYDVFVREELTDYWEDYKSLSKSELKEYMKKANFNYVKEK